MSSSSSLSAARRRRAGGQQIPVSNHHPQPPTSQQSQPTPSGKPLAPNPYVLLQQHHIKINELERKINEISSEKNSESISTNVSLDAGGNSQIDPVEFSDMIINKIESQLDLKAFYDNDTRLADEMEELNKIVQSQQLLINEMNSTLFHVIQQLHIQNPSEIDSKKTLDAVEDIHVNTKQHVSFVLSEKDYAGIEDEDEDEDELSNYEGVMNNTMTSNMINIDPSSNIVDTSDNIINNE
tara:strand:+ start:1314 stop:2030 length:717 start_codon:yes stop_codon:yes gene_type:complete